MLQSNRRSVPTLALISFVFCTMAASAQQPPPEQPSEPFYKRFSFGVRGGLLLNQSIGSQTIVENTSTTDPPLTTINYSNSASKRFTVGPTVHFRLSDRLGINVDALYSRTGYDAGNSIYTQETEDDDSEFISGNYERTRANYWDIPILARYYNTHYEAEGMRAFITGGIALRTVSGIKTFWETINEDALSDTNTIPMEPANKSALGAVAGAGLRIRDQVGLKIELEARYTRWFRKTFESDPTHSSLNQGAILLSFSF